MACYRPLQAYSRPGGGVAFNTKEGYRDRPLKIKCGQCIGCRLDRTRGWAIRAVHEAQMHEKNSFLTLTYDTENLPEDHGLNVKHWQKFARRVRKKIGPFRFLHCGEYGDQTLRPHYHACIFGQDFREDSIQLTTNNTGDYPLRISERLRDLWPLGFHTIGELTFDSAAYVASYALKKATGAIAEERYERVDPETGECWKVKPDYATMSLKPGLGKTWWDKYKGDIYPEDVCVLKGTKFRPPEYYDKLLEKTDPKMHKKMIEKRRKQVRKKPEELTEKRLEIRETVTWAKLTTYGNREYDNRGTT